MKQGSTQFVHVCLSDSDYADTLAETFDYIEVVESDDNGSIVSVTYTYDDATDEATDYWHLAALLTAWDNADVEDGVEWQDDDARTQTPDEGMMAFHYSDMGDIYRDALASVSGLSDDKAYTGSLAGHAGWYTTRQPSDEDGDPPESDRAEFTKLRRPNTLPDDWTTSTVAKNRSYYTLLSYAPSGAYSEEWYDPSKSGQAAYPEGNSPLPDYEDIEALTLAVDLDLKDGYKARPLPQDAQDAVERRLTRWVDIIRQVFGANTPVRMLDSGGGAYIFIPPMATQPIIEEFSGKDRRLVINHIIDRWNEFCESVEATVNAEDEYPDGLLSADLITHKNRQYKAIGSVHSSLDAVVHPIDPDDIDYDAMSVGDMDDDTYESFEEWAADFTSDDHADDAGRLARSIWFDRIDDDDLNEQGKVPSNYDWTPLVSGWLDAEKEARASKRNRNSTTPAELESIRGMGVTTRFSDVVKAVNNISVPDVVDALGIDHDDGSADVETDFDPFWRSSSTNRSAVVIDEHSFLDKADPSDTRRGADVLVALDAGIISEPDDNLTGSDWHEALDRLRSIGYNIPVLIPDITDESNEYDQMPLWALCDAAVALDIVTESEGFETATGNDGSEYRRFARMSDKQVTIRALERGLGIDTGYDLPPPQSDADTDKAAADGGTQADDAPAPTPDPDDGEDAIEKTDGVNWFTADVAQGSLLSTLQDDCIPEGWGRDLGDLKYPVFNLPDLYALHIAPTLGGTLKWYVVDDNWDIAWTKEMDAEGIQKQGQRWHYAGDIIDGWDIPDPKSTKDEVYQTLCLVRDVLTNHLPDDFQEPPVIGFFKSRTEQVLGFKQQGVGIQLAVKLEQDPRSPWGNVEPIKFTHEDFEPKSAEGFRKMYLGKFGARILPEELDADSLNDLMEYWLDETEWTDSEEDIVEGQAISAVETLLETFTLYPHSDFGLRKWTPNEPVGVVEDDYEYKGDTLGTALVVGGSYFYGEVTDDIPDEFDSRDLSRTLQQKGILMHPVKQGTSDYGNKQVWVFDFDELPLDDEDIKTEDDEDDATDGEITTDVDNL